MKLVIKLGGDIVKGEFPQNLLKDIKELRISNHLILVHGGGDVVTDIATKLGKEQKFVVSPDGIRSRYTDRETMDIFTMVMCGKIAKKLVEILARNGIQAVSLSGLDGGVLRASRKRKLLTIDERGRKVIIDGGYTGRMESGGGPVIEALLERGIVPIISPVAMGEEAEPLNVDSDRAAAYVAIGSRADAVVFLTDVNGLQLDGRVVESLTVEEARTALPEIGFGMQKKYPGRDRGDGGRSQRGNRGVRPGRVATGSRHVSRRLHGDTLMTMIDVMAVEDEHGPQTYQKFPLIIVRGSGAELWDDKGNKYIDCMGGYGVAIAGHCNPDVVAAVKAQAEKLITCHGSLYNDARAEFLEKLVTHAPEGLDAAFLSNSGAEANEVAIKLAKKFTGKKMMIAMKGAFHGKTAGALSATWNKKYKEPFEPLLQTFKHVEFGNLQELEAAIDGDTAAVMLEPIQGEGGVIMPPEGYLKGVREICDRKGILLIADEIQTGLGRTGKLWACDNWGVIPDIVTSAKGLAGGVPIGATIARKEILHSLKKGEQTSTFGGNPLACAAGSALLDYVSKHDLPGQAVTKGRYFKDKLNALLANHRIGREVRGMGLMLAIEMRVDIHDILMASIAERVLFTYSGRTVVRLLPPLVITEAQIDESVAALHKVISAQELKQNG